MKRIVKGKTYYIKSPDADTLIRDINEGKWLLSPDCDPDNTYMMTSKTQAVKEAIIYTKHLEARLKAMESELGFIPADDRVLIEPDPETAEYKGMITIPEQFREVAQTGTIRAVGPGRFTETGDFIEQRYVTGTRVLLSKFSGTVIMLGTKTYRLCQQAEIMGTILETEDGLKAPGEVAEEDRPDPTAVVTELDHEQGIATFDTDYTETPQEENRALGQLCFEAFYTEPGAAPWTVVTEAVQEKWQRAARFMFERGRISAQQRLLRKRDRLAHSSQARDFDMEVTAVE